MKIRRKKLPMEMMRMTRKKILTRLLRRVL